VACEGNVTPSDFEMTTPPGSVSAPIAACSNIMRTRDAAAYIGLAESTLEKRRVSGGGPKFIRLGRSIRYRVEDLEAFLAEHVFGSTSEYAAVH
jgi:predicted DNA-binding transcriptional regulator AlpA